MKALAFFMFLLMTLQLGTLQFFLEDNSANENIIKGIYDYYRCESIILFFSHRSPADFQDIEIMIKLENLFMYLSRNLIQATITNVDDFIINKSKTLHHLGNNLLVFLDDSHTLKTQLMTQLAPSTDMSQPVWLVFFSDNTEITEFFADFYIPFDCRFMVSQTNISDNDDSKIIIEIYNINKDSELRQNIFGGWGPDTGIKLPKLTLYERRNDLYGYSLRAVSIRSKVQSLIVEKKNQTVKISKYVGPIIIILQQKLNFTFTHLSIPIFGDCLDNGTWTGAVGTLIHDISDIILTTVRMTSDLTTVIDFTHPIMMAIDSFYYKKIDDTVSWATFLQPFNRSIWITLLCVIMITGLIISLILLFYRKKYPCMRVNGKPLNDSDAFLDVFGAFCGQAMPKSTIDSIMIIQYTIHLTAIVMFAAYSGVLISTLTISSVAKNRKTLKDFLNDNFYQMGIAVNSPYREFFENSPDEIMHRIYKKKLLLKSSPSTYKDGLKRVCAEENYAFLASHITVSEFYQKDCILKSSENVIKASLSLALQRRSPYRGLFNHHISGLRDTGVLQKIKHSRKRVSHSEITSHFDSVDFGDILPLIIFVIGNYFISCLFLLCEKLIYRNFMERKQKLLLNIKISTFLDKRQALPPIQIVN